MENIEHLTSPPVVGETYIVPCVFGRIYPFNYTNQNTPRHTWPVLRPSHEDSKYTIQTRTVWDGEVDSEEEYCEYDPSTPHHFHVDPRFSPAEWYTDYEVRNESWHTFVGPMADIEWREMVCLREMSIQRLFTGFHKSFVVDHTGKKSKCMRCPHKGVNLASMPVVDGVVTCPAHGLRFDKKTMTCITKGE